MAVFREVTCQGTSQMGCTVRSLETSSQVIWGSRFQGELFSESLVSSELDIYPLTCYLWLSKCPSSSLGMLSMCLAILSKSCFPFDAGTIFLG